MRRSKIDGIIIVSETLFTTWTLADIFITRFVEIIRQVCRIDLNVFRYVLQKSRARSQGIKPNACLQTKVSIGKGLSYCTFETSQY